MAHRIEWICRVWMMTAVCVAATLTVLPVQAESPQGMYFAKKEYVPHPLPTFAETRDKLPNPIYDENPLYVQMYWKTWELAFRNFYEPKPGSGFVSQFMDAAFNENIFLWDTCFGGHVTTLVAEPSETQPDTVSVKVESDGAFDLRIERGGKRWDFKVEKGTNDFVLK